MLTIITNCRFCIGVAAIPTLAILFLIIAIFGINKDERLVRSAERLR